MSGVWHIPPGQEGNSDALDFPLAWAAKVESAVVRCDWPQLGQASGAWLPRTSFSNLVPQSSQTYSKIGMASHSKQSGFNFNSSVTARVFTARPPPTTQLVLAPGLRGLRTAFRRGSRTSAASIRYKA